MQLTNRVKILGVIFAFALSLMVPLANAQEQGQEGGSGLQLSPTRTELTVQPGEQKEFSIILKNITSTDLTAQAVLNDFESDNVSGTPQIIVDPNQRTPYTLEKILKGYKDIELKAGETKEIKLRADVPVDIAPGAYFGALRYAAVPKGQSLENDRQVALTASVAHLVLVEVPGDVQEQIQVTGLSAQRGGKNASFLVNTPEQYAVGIKNLGNGFARPFGKVTVNGPLGNQIQQYDVNNTDPRGIVLPKSSRTFTDPADKLKVPGKYNLTASVAYGNGGEVVTFKSSFWYMPLWFIAVLLVLLAALAAGGYALYRRFAGGKVVGKKGKNRK